MSVLEVPRFFFSGNITWDPIVTNNYDTFYDESAGESVLPSGANNVKAFRQAAITSVTQGNWNPHGTHRVVFYDSSISGVDLGSGVVTKDPFVTAAAQFSGMLVDLEPFGAFSSQLFFNNMTFGVAGGYRVVAPRSARLTARYINFARNPANNMIAGVASVVWQTSFAKENGLRIDAFDSPFLQALDAALQANDVLGLTVRFNSYRTIYFDGPALSNGSASSKQASQELQAKLEAGGFQPNPARSRLVGVIGLWRLGEPAHESSDRALLPVGNSPLGAASTRLDPKTLTLDLSNCVPEESRDLTKKNVGTLSVVAVDPATAKQQVLGTLTYDQYNRTAYERSSGIVAIPLTPALAQFAADKDIQVRNPAGAVLLGEQSLRAIPATPNLYLDQGASAAAKFQVYDRGKGATSKVPVTLFTMSADGGTIEKQESLTTDADGVLVVNVVDTLPSIFAYVTSPNGVNPPTNGIDPQLNTYMYIRTRPVDANIAALPATWDNVYTMVLANWNAMAPCMDNWLKLDDPVQVQAQAPVIKRLTDPANFEDFRFMPVTRDMTAGERTLLYNFLDTPLTEDAATLTSVAPAATHFAALSRKQRRP